MRRSAAQRSAAVDGVVLFCVLWQVRLPPILLPSRSTSASATPRSLSVRGAGDGADAAKRALPLQRWHDESEPASGAGPAPRHEGAKRIQAVARGFVTRRACEVWPCR
jgi:hypothetical protein